MRAHAQPPRCSGAVQWHAPSQALRTGSHAIWARTHWQQGVVQHSAQRCSANSWLTHSLHSHRRDSFRSQLPHAGDVGDASAARQHQRRQAADGAADRFGNGTALPASASGTATEAIHASADSNVRGEADGGSGSAVGGAAAQQAQPRRPRLRRERLQRSALAVCKCLWRSQTSSWRRLRRVRLAKFVPVPSYFPPMHPEAGWTPISCTFCFAMRY